MHTTSKIVIVCFLCSTFFVALGIIALYDRDTPLPVGDTEPADFLSYWTPPVHASLQIQLSENITAIDAVDMYQIDLFDTSTHDIQRLHRAGVKVICYFSAGSLENWRPDTSVFPEQVIGMAYSGWDGEYWLDIRQQEILLPIMRTRMRLAHTKGCDGVEPDNIDVIGNDTGFPITPEEQLAYSMQLAQIAHAEGLAIGLKNNPAQAAALAPYYEWATIESCSTYHWCNNFSIFTLQHKPVFQIEYTEDPEDIKNICTHRTEKDFTVLFKKRQLDSWGKHCDDAGT